MTSGNATTYEGSTFNNLTTDGPELYEVIDQKTYAVILACIAGTGVIGNTLIFILMLTAYFRGFSSSIYLRYIAVFDTVVLVQTVTEDIIEKFHGWDSLYLAFFQEKTSCYFWSVTLTVSRFISPWLVGILGMDRFIAVVVPHKQHKFCTKRNAHIATAVVVTSSIVCEFFSVLCDTQTACYIGQDVCTIHDSNPVVFFVMQTFLRTHLPLIVILVFNTWTVVTLRMQSEWTMAKVKRSHTRPTLERTTWALVIMSLVSFLALFPKAVVEIVELVLLRDELSSYDADTKMSVDMAWLVCNAIMLLNFAQNFYVLLSVSPLYRRSMIMLCRKTGVAQEHIRMSLLSNTSDMLTPEHDSVAATS